MKLPSRIIDLSSPLENETVYDPPFMRPKIAYHSNADTAPLLCELFPGLRREDLPDGEGWAMEEIQLNTHNGTHMDAPQTRPSCTPASAGSKRMTHRSSGKATKPAARFPIAIWRSCAIWNGFQTTASSSRASRTK